MNTISFEKAFLFPYLKVAPVALAVERTLECEILKEKSFVRPVLDVGCGEGLFAGILFREMIDVGIDPNPQELDRARDLNRYQELICCYGDQIPKADKSFQTVFSNSVLEHIENVDPVLREIHRLLADDGNVYVTVPTDYFEQNTVINQILMFFGLKTLSMRWRKFFNRFWVHHHAYDAKGWAALFAKNGFKVEQSRTYCPPVVGIFDDLFSPLASLAFIQKRFFNRWFLVEMIRKPFARAWAWLYAPVVRAKAGTPEDGLVFFHLKKA